MIKRHSDQCVPDGGFPGQVLAKGDSPDYMYEWKDCGVPSGAIIMWSGILTIIPRGWFLCDGANGTPDLRDKFIYGWTDSVNPGGTGGNLTHTHTDHTYTPQGTVGAPTLSWPAGVPAFAGSALSGHSHGAGTLAVPSHSFNNALITISVGGLKYVTTETHTVSGSTASVSAGTPAGTVAWPADVPTASAPGFTGTQATISHSSTNHLPPYFKLAFLMKS